MSDIVKAANLHIANKRITKLEAQRDELLDVLRGEEDRGYCLSPPARAWLLAVLRALLSEEEVK